MDKITVGQLLAELQKQAEKDENFLNKELYIEAADNKNFEDPTSGWKSFRDSEDLLLVSPAWAQGVLISVEKDKVRLYINY